MPRRGQRPDHHLPHAYHLGGWHGVDLYRRWVEGGMQPLGGEHEAHLLSDFLGCVLQSGAAAHCIARGNAYDLEGRSDAFDVQAPPERQREMLLALGWEGTWEAARLADRRPPSCVSHILDRLESECALDIAHETGEAGEALREACGERAPDGESGDDDDPRLRTAMRGAAI